MASLTDAIAATERLTEAVARDPESPATEATAREAVALLENFLASPEASALRRLPPEHRSAVSRKLGPGFHQAFANLQNILNVTLQMHELGADVEWVTSFDEAVRHYAELAARIGVHLDSGLRVPPMVTRQVGEDGRPSYHVVVEDIRVPRLDPYIAAALERARLKELEDGSWFAELDDDFPGVWADGASRDEARATLAEVLHEWLLVKAAHGDRDLPVVADLDPRVLLFPD